MASDYPPPLIVPPSALPHKQTFILLHGRGSSGDKFGPVLLDTPISTFVARRSGEGTDNPQVPPSPDGSQRTAGEPTTTPPPSAAAHTLARAFPHARFVFPTAARRRATVYRRARTRQWFDNWELDDAPQAAAAPTAASSAAVVAGREALQLPGLRETTANLHGLLRAEIAAAGGDASRVVLGGLSQGCAAALVALLLWEGPPLAAAVGMCGWLPFAGRLADEAGTGTSGGRREGFEEAVEDEVDDIFDRDGEEGKQDGTDGRGGSGSYTPAARALRWFREELELPPAADSRDAGSAFTQTLVFLGHGVEDDRVNVAFGREAAACLDGLRPQRVVWKEYAGLGHWYSGEMLQDVVQWLRRVITN